MQNIVQKTSVHYRAFSAVGQKNQWVRKNSLLPKVKTRTIQVMSSFVRKMIILCMLAMSWISIIHAQNFLATQDTLWPVLGNHFTLSEANLDQETVQRQIDLALRHPRHLYRVTQNAQPYLFYVYQETKKYHMPAELALLPMIESEYEPHSYSHCGAVGLWQLMPDTAYGYGVKMNSWYDGRRSTTVSTRVALHFLSYLYEQFHHNWLLALAAYNAGPGTVTAAIRYNKERGLPTDFWALHLPNQTKIYVPKLLALATIVEHPNAYGVKLAPIANEPVSTSVTIKKQMDLTTIAHLANTSVSTVKKLNPALKTSRTPPHQKMTLMLPVNQKPGLEKKLAESKNTTAPIKKHKLSKTHPVAQAKKKKGFISANQFVTQKGLYTVQSGDNLHIIAEHFNITTLELMHRNHLQSATLQIGEKLRV